MPVNRALGTLDPIVYFSHPVHGIALPPSGKSARFLYEARGASGRSFKDHGFEYCEAGTLAEVDALQKRLVAQEMEKLEAAAYRDDAQSAGAWREVGDRLRGKMVSGSTSPYEREFIEHYLKLREQKRDRHRQRWMERTMFLEAREMDDGHKLEIA